MKEIKIMIHKGKARVEVSGVQGPACKELTKQIEAALGQVESVTKKTEFHQLGQAVGHQLYQGHS